MASVENTLTAAEWQSIFTCFNHACAYCLRDNVPLEQEHMRPISRGGTHSRDNVVPACRACNAGKGTKGLLEFTTSLSFDTTLPRAA